jgi:CHAD domain-containing protein
VTEITFGVFVRGVLAEYAHDFLARIASFDSGGNDPEIVHRARVAVRRLRSALRTCERLFAFGWARERRDRLRRLSDELSAARDGDILLARAESRAGSLPSKDRPAAEAILAALREERARTYERLRQIRQDAEHVELENEVSSIADEPVVWRSDSPAACVAPRLVRKTFKRLRKRVRNCGEEPSDEQLHAVRIAAKHYRYALEAFEPVTARRMRKVAHRVQRLQDVLGEEHDAAVAEQRLRGLAAEAKLAFVSGEMTQLEEKAKVEARSQWRRAWRRVREASSKV